MKIRPLGAELFHAGRWKDGRTDMTKLTVDVSNFENAPKAKQTAISAETLAL
jgi:hypothetical protein